MTVAETRDTKERILDAAEILFAEKGFAATSLRNITTAAGANLAAVNYHFGSKDTLIESVFSRRLEPLNRERLALLDEIERQADDDRLVERIVEAFIGPPLRMSHDPRRGGVVFMRLLGHAMNQPKRKIRKLLFGQFREVAQRFGAALQSARPELPAAEVLWRLIFMAGSMAHTMALSDEIGEMSNGVCDPTDVETTIQRLVPFLSAAIRTSEPSLSQGAS